MHNYFLRIAYDGTDYRGLQRQPGGVRTVQEEVEALLRRVHRSPGLTFNGCGRTDAGVHATQFYGHITLAEPPPEEYLFILNKQLPAGIIAHELIPVHAKAHARFDATERTYDYFWSATPDAFAQRFQSWLPATVQPTPERKTALKQCLQALEGTHDFRAFCKSADKHNTTLCTFTAVNFYTDGAGRYRLRFVANRFLRGMIRILVHDLLAVLAGTTSPTAFRALLTGTPRPAVVRLAPPEGLFLTGVRYPYIDRPAELPATHGSDWSLV